MLFNRGDYKELCELVVVFLGGHVAGFTFKRPGGCNHARFIAKAIDSTKMALLSQLLDANDKIKRVMS